MHQFAFWLGFNRVIKQISNVAQEMSKVQPDQNQFAFGDFVIHISDWSTPVRRIALRMGVILTA